MGYGELLLGKETNLNYELTKYSPSRERIQFTSKPRRHSRIPRTLESKEENQEKSVPFQHEDRELLLFMMRWIWEQEKTKVVGFE